jgi:phage host-nuclease inhibitor protein Gam
MSKQKFVPMNIATEEGLNAAVADFVKLKLSYAAKKAAMELAVANVQEKFQDPMAELAEKIESRYFGILGYCETHRAALFHDKRKSLDLVTASLGFRTNPPSVQVVGKKMKLGEIAKKLLNLEWGKLFVRYPEPEVDKESILAARAKLTAEQLASVNLSIQAEEEFFITPKADMAQADTGLIA